MQIRQAVGVVGEKGLFAHKVFLDGHEALTDIRIHAGVRKRDSPIRDVPIHQLDLTTAPGKNEVVGPGLFVVEEVLLDDVSTIPEAEDEVGVTIVSVVLHQVPEDRPMSDLHHWLRNIVTCLSQTHTETTAKDDDLHAPTSANARSGADVQRRDSSMSPAARSAPRRLMRKYRSPNNCSRVSPFLWNASRSCSIPSRTVHWGRYSGRVRISLPQSTR